MPVYIINHFVLLHSEVFTQLHPESIFLLSFLTLLTSLLVTSPSTPPPTCQRKGGQGCSGFLKTSPDLELILLMEEIRLTTQHEWNLVYKWLGYLPYHQQYHLSGCFSAQVKRHIKTNSGTGYETPNMPPISWSGFLRIFSHFPGIIWRICLFTKFIHHIIPFFLLPKIGKKFRAKWQNQIARAFIGRRMTDLIHVGPGQSHSLRCKPLSIL